MRFFQNIISFFSFIYPSFLLSFVSFFLSFFLIFIYGGGASSLILLSLFISIPNNLYLKCVKYLISLEIDAGNRHVL